MELKYVLIVGLCLCYIASVHSASVEIFDHLPDLESRQCVKGPAYWCKNITTAKNCNAVKHCIQTVWELQTLPADNDDVCKICKDMVTEARTQLESNQTQEELREVFEGSCKLIPLKIVQQECIKLSDEFIPELVETLASQMNPQVVCSVAGLCNNARIDQLLAAQGDSSSEEVSSEISSPDKCEGCALAARAMEKKFLSTPKDEIMKNMVEACGRFGSFSDGCAAIVITHFESLYAHLQKNFNGDGLCHLSGMCQYKFHTHEDGEESEDKRIKVVHTSTVGVLKPQNNHDSETCSMCKELVLHLRDFLVANTTEAEFERVMIGICKQFKSFKSQCLSIVEEYYAVIYDFLANELNPKEVCSIVSLCRPPTLGQSPIWPLVPAETVHKYEAFKSEVEKESSQRIIGQDEANSLKVVHRVSLGKDDVVVNHQAGLSWLAIWCASLVPFRKQASPASLEICQVYSRQGLPLLLAPSSHPSSSVLPSVRVADKSWAPLPVERMLPATITYVGNKEVCTFCEYFLHYLQTALTSPSTESEIKDIVDKACDHLPQTVEEQCRSFVDTYGNALIAMLAQEIDPSQVCPKLGLCPQSQVLVDITSAVEDKPTCPLCLFAVEELITELKDNKTEDRIRRALDKLCVDLPNSLVGECRTFVENYSEELVDMIVADFTPQEVCTYLRLCDPPGVSDSENEILTNDIPQLPMERFMPKIMVDEEIRKIKAPVKDSSLCVMCEFVISKVDSALKDKTTEDEIKQVVHDVCNWMPKTIVAECNKFVDQYADLIITLLAQNVDPKEVCTEMRLCEAKAPQPISGAMDQCVVCDALMGALEGAMEDPSVDKDAAKALQKVCSLMPTKDQEKCKSMVKIYGPSILNLLARETPINYICEKLGLCPQHRQVVGLLGGKRCTWGPGYWCQSLSHAKACGAVAHCQERVWKSQEPKQ